MDKMEAKKVAKDHGFEFREDFSRYTYEENEAAVEVNSLGDIVTVAQECPSASRVEGVAMSYVVF